VRLQRVGPRQRVKFPVNIPVNRGEEFALDCVLRHAVGSFLSGSLYQPKSRDFRLKIAILNSVPRPLLPFRSDLADNRARFL